jgi:hypothetical protein
MRCSRTARSPLAGGLMAKAPPAPTRFRLRLAYFDLGLAFLARGSARGPVDPKLRMTGWTAFPEEALEDQIHQRRETPVVFPHRDVHLEAASVLDVRVLHERAEESS